MNHKVERVYVLHKTGACATGGLCDVCGEPIVGEHYFVDGDVAAHYYHLGTCVTASRLGAPDEYNNG